MPCPHGRRARSRCKECGGSSKERGGRGLCEHGRQRYYCKECGGKGVCEHGRLRKNCIECDGSGICEHGRGRQRIGCKECGGQVTVLEVVEAIN